jgi:hypothetical protein
LIFFVYPLSHFQQREQPLDQLGRNLLAALQHPESAIPREVDDRLFVDGRRAEQQAPEFRRRRQVAK